MRVKNLTWYTSLDTILLTEDALENKAFAPCSKVSTSSMGWIKPLDGESYIIEQSGCQVIMLKIEKKHLPVCVVKARHQEMIERYQAREGVAPHRKIKNELKDDATAELLAKAFSKYTIVPVVIMNRDNRILVMSNTASLAREVIIFLGMSLAPHKLNIDLPRTELDSVNVFTQWVTDGAPEDFSVSDKFLFQNIDGATLSSNTIPADDDILSQAIENGFCVESLKVSWRDLVSLKVNGSLTLSSTKVIASDDAEIGDEDHAVFFHELGVFLSWISAFLDDLVAAMGGLDKRLVNSQNTRVAA